jgi:hypothetical protein
MIVAVASGSSDVKRGPAIAHRANTTSAAASNQLNRTRIQLQPSPTDLPGCRVQTSSADCEDSIRQSPHLRWYAGSGMPSRPLRQD